MGVKAEPSSAAAACFSIMVGEVEFIPRLVTSPFQRTPELNSCVYPCTTKKKILGGKEKKRKKKKKTTATKTHFAMALHHHQRTLLHISYKMSFQPYSSLLETWEC